MELALNLGWLVITGLLFACVVLADRRGRLQLPLKLALATTAVLALLLFPVISMTDDLQQSNLVAEWPGSHSEFQTGAPTHDAPVAGFPHASIALGLLLLALAGAMSMLLATLLESEVKCSPRDRQQPYAVRPPPFSLFPALA